MAGLGRGGRGALLLKALETPTKIPRQPFQNGVTESKPPVEANGFQTTLAPKDSRPIGIARCQPTNVMGRGSLAQQLLAQQNSKSPPSKGNPPDDQQKHLNKNFEQKQAIQPTSASLPLPQSPCLPRDAQQQASPPAKEFSEMKLIPRKKLEKGTAGTTYPMQANFIPFKSRREGAYQYNVTFDPPIEYKSMRFGLLNEHLDVIGKTKAFDGSSLYLPHKLPESPIKLRSKRTTDGADVELTITLVKVLEQTQCLQLYNIVLRKVMKILEMSQVGRHYYDPKRPAMIPQHKLELWPGYITSITAYEGGVMLLADVSHRLLRTETCLQFMYDIIMKHPNTFQAEVTKHLVGTVVLTRYNNQTYRIDDIAWDKSPESTFTYYTGEEMTYCDYYKKAYNLTLSDSGQPLLIHRPKETKGVRQKDRRLEVICLIPELCSMTGLTDVMRSDFRVMKDIAQHTRITPNQRKQAMVKYINNIYSNANALGELQSWGLELDKDLLKVEGRLLPSEKVVFGSKSTIVSPQADWARDATNEHVISAVSITNWIVVVTKRDQKKAVDFIQTMKKCCPPMGIQCADARVLAIRDDRTETYLRTIRENLNPQVQCVVCIFPTARDDRYAAVKKLCCIESPVPSQMINARTISQANKLRSVTQKVALQINCKLGGELWALQIPMKNVMVVGIDVYHDSSKASRSIGGFVASTNKTFTRWYSRCCFQMPGQELIDGLKICFISALKKYHEENHSLPEKIIVYRDGVGDGQLSTVANYEVKQFEDCFPMLGETYQPKMCVIVVQKRISQRLFAIQGGGSLDNPQPGSVVDHSITRLEWDDFFLVSQHVRHGTVTPTHYVIVYDNTNMKTDHIQRLSYKLTHLYYNWPGTIRVPAPCQYAHKLAFLVGQSLHKTPAMELSDRLFFL